MRPSSLTVIGLGAIGGSLAWQARLAGVARVVGYSPSRAEAVEALHRQRRWLEQPVPIMPLVREANSELLLALNLIDGVTAGV